MIRFLVLLLVGLAALVAVPARSAPAIALGYVPRYQAGFSHFDYVNPDAPKGGQLVLPATGSFDTLNPFTLKGDKEAGVSLLTLDTLLAQSEDEPFSLYGLLAEDVVLAPDGLSVIFRLNPKARFVNGDPVTAADVVASFRTLTTDRTATPLYRVYWADVAEAAALNSRTVRFTFKRRNAELHLILGQLPVFSRKWIPPGRTLADVATTPPIGSGPYVLESWAAGRYARYRRNPAYWAVTLPVRRGMYNFDHITFRYYQDTTARLEAFKAGEFDLIEENTAKDWARGYNGPRFRDGRILRRTLPHENSAGMQGFVFNLRRPLFADRRVRQALSLAFDFEWANRQLFYNQYRRSDSYFTNSEMAARGLPTQEEMKLLAPLRARLDPAVFGEAVLPPDSAGPYGLRNNLKRARSLLFEAGWRYEGGRLVDRNGRPFVFEFLSFSRSYERIVSVWQRNLARLGITLNVRVVDPAIYQRRMDRFEYDSTVVVYGASQSPGNEQLDFHSCEAARTPGSRNWAGLCDPAVESLLQHFLHFESRTELVAASRALDRVLRAGHYVVPNWYLPYHRVAWWNRFGQPARTPRYYPIATYWALETWWALPRKEQR
ncbi:extracellular solute-binding protein [Gulbenkiania mobilis]|uniref:extracellular solute-binding protein n=1 Tax=Gulbenkiania mobilis TaxID=397457 RepID=UPI0006BBAB01|nr:extracellular solute-binding protein [Gulbenkiania mobilis]